MGLDQYIIYYTGEDKRNECLYLRKNFTIDTFMKRICIPTNEEDDSLYYLTNDKILELYTFVRNKINHISFLKNVGDDVLYALLVNNMCLKFWIAMSLNKIQPSYKYLDRFDDVGWEKFKVEHFTDSNDSEIEVYIEKIFKSLYEEDDFVDMYSGLDWEYYGFFLTFVTIYELIKTGKLNENINLYYERSY